MNLQTRLLPIVTLFLVIGAVAFSYQNCSPMAVDSGALSSVNKNCVGANCPIVDLGTNCPATFISWEVNGKTCSALLPIAISGDSQIASDNDAPEKGNATFSCLNTVRTQLAGATCATVAGATPTPTPVPTAGSCTGSVAWSENGIACGNPTTVTLKNGDAQNFTDSAVPGVGSATVKCVNGKFEVQAGAKCSATAPSPSPTPSPTPGAPVTKSCPAGKLHWMVQDISYTASFQNYISTPGKHCSGDLAATTLPTGTTSKALKVESSNGRVGKLDVKCELDNAGNARWIADASKLSRCDGVGGSNDGSDSNNLNEPVKPLRAMIIDNNAGANLLGLAMVARGIYAGDALFSPSKVEFDTLGDTYGSNAKGTIVLGFNTVTVPSMNFDCRTTDPDAAAPVKSIYRCVVPNVGHFVTEAKNCDGVQGANFEGSLGCVFKNPVSTSELVATGNPGLKVVPLYRCRSQNDSSAVTGNSKIFDLVTPSQNECQAIVKMKGNGVAGVTQDGIGTQITIGYVPDPL